MEISRFSSGIGTENGTELNEELLSVLFKLLLKKSILKNLKRFKNLRGLMFNLASEYATKNFYT